MAKFCLLLTLCLAPVAISLSPSSIQREAISRRGAFGTFAGSLGIIGGLGISPSRAIDDGFETTPSGLKIKYLKKPDMSGLITNGLKAGDYIRVDIKAYTNGFGGTLIDSTDVTGPVSFQLGVGATKGSTGYPSPGSKVSARYEIPVLKAYDEVCIGHAIGDKFQMIVPPELGFGSKGGVTGIGYEVKGGETLYYEVRLRSRVFAGVLDRPQETFMDDDQIGKFNAMMGIAQDTRPAFDKDR